MLVTLSSGKTGFWVRWVGLPFDRAVKFHRQLGRVTLIAASIHFAMSAKEVCVGPIILSGGRFLSPGLSNRLYYFFITGTITWLNQQ